MIPKKDFSRARRLVLGLVLLAAVCDGVGCGLPKQWHLLADKLPEATSRDPAYQMLCVWEPSEGVDEHGMPTRGFAGKITFFTRRQKTGVRVRGDVLVSVFDDQSPIEMRGQPIRNWEFLGDAWAIHLQDSQIGPAYSVFIPYSRKGTHQAQCALQVKFTPEGGGPPLHSDTVAVLLPGPPGKREHQPLNASQTDKRTSLTSITIPLHEKRKAHLESLELGKTERQHTVAPASELFQQQPSANLRPQLPPVGQRPWETTPEVMETLPAPPQGIAPATIPPQTWDSDAAVKPLPTEHSARTAEFTRVPQAPPKPKHPLLGGDEEEPAGSNPFNR